MNIIEIEGLSYFYGSEKQGIENINLKITPGMVYGLIGRNGSGKTTLIRSIMGQIKPVSGTVKVFDKNPVKSPEEVFIKTGYMDEDRTLYSWMTVSEIINFSAKFYPVWNYEKVYKMADEFKLPLNKKISSLSSGMKAEVALILALGNEPELLVLDEPANGLDPIVRREYMEKCIDFACNENRAVVLSSHLLEDVERVCDHIGILHEGKIIMTGNLETVREGFKKETGKTGLEEYFRFVVSEKDSKGGK